MSRGQALPAVAPSRLRPSYAAAFWGLMLRDARLLRRDLFSFITRTVMNPLFFVFIFTDIMPKIGQNFSGVGAANFATILVPGLVGIAILFQGIMAVALPLSVELGGTHEIEDRLMAPLPIGWIAFEKIFFSVFQSFLAAAVVFPMVYFIPATPVHVQVASWGLLVVVIILSSFAAGALGLTLGTLVRPEQIGMIFAVVLTPIIFLGCVYYPWALLGRVKWLQIVTLANPLVYVSEGLRAALTPAVAHMPSWAFLSALVLSTAGFGWWGIAGFRRRVIG
ncbi:MAG: ABC transporter permease [Terriglobales bacterium]